MARPGRTEGEGPQAGHRPFSDSHADWPSRPLASGDAQGGVPGRKGWSERLGARRERALPPWAPHEEAGLAEQVNAHALSVERHRIR